MANNYNKVEYKDVDYYMRDSRYFLVESKHIGSSNRWTGDLPEGIDDYNDYDTLIIDYWLKNESNGQPVTLSLGGKANKKVYLSHGDDQVTDEFEANSVIRLAYIGTLDNGNGGWKVVGSDASGSGGGVLDKTWEYPIKSISLTGGSQASLTYDNNSKASKAIYTDTSHPTTAEIENGVLNIKTGSAENLRFTDVDVSQITSWTTNSLQSLSTPETVKVVKDVTMVEPED